METRAFTWTSEFSTVAAVLAALAVSATVSDSLDGRLAWLLAAALVGGYALSRGLAKAHAASAAWDPRESLGDGDAQPRPARERNESIGLDEEEETRQMSTVPREDYGTQMGGPMYAGPGQWGYGRGWGGPRPQYPIETKPFFLTSEFWACVALVAGAAIAAGTVEDVDARLFWTLATAVTIGYVLSRGIAKSGTKSRSWDPREDLTQRLRERVQSGNDGRD